MKYYTNSYATIELLGEALPENYSITLTVDSEGAAVIRVCQASGAVVAEAYNIKSLTYELSTQMGKRWMLENSLATRA